MKAYLIREFKATVSFFANILAWIVGTCVILVLLATTAETKLTESPAPESRISSIAYDVKMAAEVAKDSREDCINEKKVKICKQAYRQYRQYKAALKSAYAEFGKEAFIEAAKNTYLF